MDFKKLVIICWFVVLISVVLETTYSTRPPSFKSLNVFLQLLQRKTKIVFVDQLYFVLPE